MFIFYKPSYILSDSFRILYACGVNDQTMAHLHVFEKFVGLVLEQSVFHFHTVELTLYHFTEISWFL